MNYIQAGGIMTKIKKYLFLIIFKKEFDWMLQERSHLWYQMEDYLSKKKIDDFHYQLAKRSMLETIMYLLTGDSY